MNDERQEREQALLELIRLHEEVGRQAAALEALHRERLVCARGCHDCCMDELTVFDIEAERIRRTHPELLRAGSPHPPGSCAFLDAEGSCRVYAERPYVCRTQGLPLRWIEETGPDEVVEMRDICPLNDGGSPIEELDPEACWTLGPTEGRLGELQRSWGKGNMDRAPLRALFSQAEPHGH